MKAKTINEDFERSDNIKDATKVGLDHHIFSQLTIENVDPGSGEPYWHWYLNKEVAYGMVFEENNEKWMSAFFNVTKDSFIEEINGTNEVLKGLGLKLKTYESGSIDLDGGEQLVMQWKLSDEQFNKFNLSDEG